MIRAAAQRRIVITVKEGVDLVTETDKACEDLITRRIKARFPLHGFVGEETTFATGSSAETLVRMQLSVALVEGGVGEVCFLFLGYHPLLPTHPEGLHVQRNVALRC